MPRLPSGLAESIQGQLHHPADLRTDSVAGGRMQLAYIASLVDDVDLRFGIVAPLEQISRDGADQNGFLAAMSGRGGRECQDLASCVNDLLHGRVVIWYEGLPAFSFPVEKGSLRKPKDPKTERTIRGPRLDFVETINDSIALIRRQIKDPRLHVDGLTLGRRTKTDIAVLYLGDVADPGTVRELFERLGRIDIDGIVESGYIEQLVSDNPNSIFPLTQSTERPDKVASALLEGRIAVVVDGSPWVVVVPTTLNELYQSPEDYYFSRWFGTFLRFFRILGNSLAIILPGLYVALVGVNPELLPTQLALTLAGSRTGTAFPLIIEVLAMEVIVEVFREASLRLPSSVGQTLGTAAGIILGLASVRAGLVSDATLVIVVITAIASFSGPSFAIGLAWRILRYLFILAAAVFGLFGVTILGLVVLTHAAHQNSFGVSYLSPWAPLNLPGLGDTVLRRSMRKRDRPETYHPLDKNRKDDGANDER